MDPNIQQPSVVAIVPPPVIPSQNLPPRSRKKMFIITGAIVAVFVMIGIATALVLTMGGKAKTSVIVTPTAVPATPTPTPNPKIILKKDVKTAIPNTNISLTFLGKFEADAGCNDCFGSTDITMSYEGKEVKLSYLCGGFSGACSIKEEGFEYIVELIQNVDPNQVEVIVTKK